MNSTTPSTPIIDPSIAQIDIPPPAHPTIHPPVWFIIKSPFVAVYNSTRFSLSELVITETELKLMAAAAIIGDNTRLFL
jgi:hypothetical protein